MTLIWSAAALILVLLIAIGAYASRRPDDMRPPIVLDGSNIMHWSEGPPSARPVGAVIEELKSRGYRPVAFFDANVGYKLINRHLDEAPLADMLRLPPRDVVIVPSGTPADPHLIEFAIARKARIVTNDRFMDWRADYPPIREKGRLVKGRMKGEGVTLTL